MILNYRNKLADTFRLLKSITFLRLYNIILINSSFFISYLLKKSIHKGMPVSVSVEPTTSCNLHCPECPSGKRIFTRPTGSLTVDLFLTIINEIKSSIVYLTLYFQGEPYLNHHFFTFVKEARKRNIYVATSTNGHFLDKEIAKKTIESGLNRLIISFDGAKQETYEMYRKGGNLEKVKEGIKNLVEARNEGKNTIYIILQFIVFKFNEEEINDIKALAKDLGVDELQLKTAQIYDYQKGNPLIPSNNKYSRYNKKDDGTYQLKKQTKNKCFRMWSSCVISWDGLVVPCCFDKDAEFKMGDLKKESFKTIWNSTKYNDFRDQILKNRKTIGICNNCSE